MTMGEKILNMRKARGWSQEELAEQIGVTRQAVSRWESGSAKPDADKIIAVCDLFGVSADYLLRDGYGEQMHTSEAEYENGKRGVTMPTIKQIVGMLLLIIGGVVIIAVLLTAILDPDKGYFSGIWGYLKYNHLLEYLLLGILAIAIGLKMLFQKRFMDPDSIDDFKTMMGM